MKKQILIILLFVLNWLIVKSQNITQSDINTTCYVLTQLMANAKKSGDIESLVIYTNTIDKIKKKYNVHPVYSSYLDSVKTLNPNINTGIIISLNSPPKLPGFTHKEIDDFMLLKNDGISLSDFNQFIVLKKLSQNQLKIENLNQFEIKKLEDFKKDVETINFNK